jgi:TPR repeat protein
MRVSLTVLLLVALSSAAYSQPRIQTIYDNNGFTTYYPAGKSGEWSKNRTDYRSKKADDFVNEVLGGGRDATEAPSSSGSVLGIEFDPLPGIHDSDPLPETASSAIQFSPAFIRWQIQQEKKAEEEKDFKRAFKRAEKGSAKDQYEVGVGYETGIGVKKNIPEAIKWYSQSARQGNIDAQFNLAQKYYWGVQLPKEKYVSRSVMIFRKAREKGSEASRQLADFMLDHVYTSSWWPKPNLAENFRENAELGDADAQLLIADCYQLGIGGVEKNSQEAFNYYSKSANQGNAEAQFSLATFYENGTCGFTNMDEAEKWYAKSAKQGYPVKQKRFITNSLFYQIKNNDFENSRIKPSKLNLYHGAGYLFEGND